MSFERARCHIAVAPLCLCTSRIVVVMGAGLSETQHCRGARVHFREHAGQGEVAFVHMDDIGCRFFSRGFCGSRPAMGLQFTTAPHLIMRKRDLIRRVTRATLRRRPCQEAARPPPPGPAGGGPAPRQQVAAGRCRSPQAQGQRGAKPSVPPPSPQACPTSLAPGGA